MFPRSSILTRRFTTTSLFASRRAPVDRLTVTIAGRSCGVRPTAIARAKSADSRTERWSNALITKIETVRATVTRIRSFEKSRSPTWKAVSGGRVPRP
jgi:hypothetical protein